MDAPVRIATALIYPSASARPVLKAHVEALALSFTAIGMQTPITVRPSLQYASGRPIDAYEIVAGHHRYRAAVKLNWTELDAYVTQAEGDDAELWEIDENFARSELTDAQRADHHSRRQTILARKGLVRSPGRGRASSEESSLPTYAEEAAESLKVTRRTVEKDLARARGIVPEVLAQVTGTDLDKGVVLDRLAAAPREDQRAVLAGLKEHQDNAKLTRTVDKTVARSNAEVAAEAVLANMDLSQVDALMARLSHVTMKDFLAALSAATAGVRRVAA